MKKNSFLLNKPFLLYLIISSIHLFIKYLGVTYFDKKESCGQGGACNLLEPDMIDMYFPFLQPFWTVFFFSTLQIQP